MLAKAVVVNARMIQKKALPSEEYLAPIACPYPCINTPTKERMTANALPA
jgi:hypothetical protein